MKEMGKENKRRDERDGAGRGVARSKNVGWIQLASAERESITGSGALADPDSPIGWGQPSIPSLPPSPLPPLRSRPP